MPAHRPPFELAPRALASYTSIMRLVGRFEGLQSPKPQLRLRRQNQVRAITGSLGIEGNTLSTDQVTAILEGRKVIGPRREILEVENAIAIYARASRLNPAAEKDFLTAHGALMKGLISDAGRYRSKGVGVVQGARVAHVAPPAKQVPRLMADLFAFIRTDRDPVVIKAAVVHYEVEFIHPFSDGNGRMGRLWQYVMLVREYPVFQWIPVESIVFSRQADYYRVLAECDRAGDSSRFVEFSLATIEDALGEFLRDLRPSAATAETRLSSAKEAFGRRQFSRKDYLELFKTLSTATASRDLREGVESGALVRIGAKALTRYSFR
jgi:Fic family protein